MSESQTMTTHPEWMVRIESTFHEDPRLIAGGAVIVAHVARRAGLDDPAAGEITSATVEACEAIARAERGTREPREMIQLAAAEYPDHIEVTIGLIQSAPDNGASSPPSKPPSDLADRIRQTMKGAAVDGVNVEIVDGSPRVILVKNCGAAKRRFVL
jgi:hypothetical protein